MVNSPPCMDSIVVSTRSMERACRQRLSRVFVNEFITNPPIFPATTSLLDDSYAPISDKRTKVHGQRLNAGRVSVATVHVVAQGTRCEVPQHTHGLDHVPIQVRSPRLA